MSDCIGREVILCETDTELDGRRARIVSTHLVGYTVELVQGSETFPVGHRLKVKLYQTRTITPKWVAPVFNAGVVVIIEAEDADAAEHHARAAGVMLAQRVQRAYTIDELVANGKVGG
jgi:hypothetical protein